MEKEIYVLSRLRSWFAGYDARRLLRVAAVVVVGTVAVAVTAPVVTAAPSDPRYPATATMRFSGALNLLGLLNSLTVSPSEVGVSSGGAVTFVNDSAVSLKLQVAGNSATLRSGGSQRYNFRGAAKPRSFNATVTPLDAAVVGDALASSGTVRVAAATSESASAGEPSQRNPGAPRTSSPSGSAPKAAESDGESASTNAQTAPSDTSAPSGTSSDAATPVTPDPSDSWTLGQAPTLDDLLQPNVTRDAAQPGSQQNAGRQGALSALTDDGRVGLMIVVAAVLLIGVTSAAMRVVVARRRTVPRGLGR